MMKEMHFDSIGPLILALVIALFLGLAQRNLKVLSLKNSGLNIRPVLLFTRFVFVSTSVAAILELLDIVFWSGGSSINSFSSQTLIIIGALTIISTILYARVLQRHTRSPEGAKNALIQEQLLLQSVSQTQRNLSLQRNVKDARRLNLKSQMNPHFLFNVLTGIQNLLMRNDSEKASLVFSKFRKLLLMGFLSHDQLIGSLQQEINHIKQYLELEDIRLEKKIEVQWEIHSNVEPLITPFPLFILQPLIENAIWHGLSSESIVAPKIIIRIEWASDDLEIFIQDNGIGFQEEIREKRKKKHPSRGSAIVRERLSLLHHSGILKIHETSVSHPFNTGITACIQLPLWSLEPSWSVHEEKRAS